MEIGIQSLPDRFWISTFFGMGTGYSNEALETPHWEITPCVEMKLNKTQRGCRLPGSPAFPLLNLIEKL
jgi:hypothetical protein